MVVVSDGSFKKPGTVPFQWEIEPGVPKLSSQPHPEWQQQLPASASCYDRPSKFKSPASDSCFPSPSDHHHLPSSSVSFRSTRSCFKVHDSGSASAARWFRTALFRKNWFENLACRKAAGKLEAGKMIRCGPELGNSVRRLVSSGKSFLASYGSSSSSPLSSHKPSPPFCVRC